MYWSLFKRYEQHDVFYDIYARYEHNVPINGILAPIINHEKSQMTQTCKGDCKWNPHVGSESFSAG